jgi:2-polyprenyl-6-methoxyphenol hydroxylase-like FAD-dependent oxidoreductase
MKAIVIGAGIGGLAAAIAMRQAGWHVSIYEQADQITPMGAALSLWPNAVAALDQIGRADALRAIAQPLGEIAVATQEGRDIGRFQTSQILPGTTGYLPTRTELQALLLDGLDDVPLHLGERLITHNADKDGVTVRFASGREDSGDLLIAADGIRSNIAFHLNGERPTHAGYGGVLALSDPVEGHPSTGTGTEYWGRGERMGLFDLKAGRKYWFYMKNETASEDSATITRAQIKERVCGWPGAIMAAVDATPDDRLIPFSIHAKTAPRHIAQGRIILLGDAAHAMEPNMGQGACQAIEDAVALGQIARVTPPEAIADRYTKLRLKRARLFVGMSREGSLIVHRLPQSVRPVAQAMMRLMFPMVGKVRLRQMYRLPDYGAMF